MGGQLSKAQWVRRNQAYRRPSTWKHTKQEHLATHEQEYGAPRTCRTGVWGATEVEDRGTRHRGRGGPECKAPQRRRTGEQDAMGVQDWGVGRHGGGGWEHKRQKGQPGEASQLRVRSVYSLCMTIFKCSGKPLEGF